MTTVHFTQHIDSLLGALRGKGPARALPIAMRWFRFAREAVWTAYWYEFCDRVIGWECPTSKEPTITWEGNLQRRVHASIYRVLGCLLYLNLFKQRFMPQSWQVALVDQTFASICSGQVSHGHIADLVLMFTSLILPSLQECICSNYLFSAQTIWYLVVSLHLLLHPYYQPLFEMYIYSRSCFFVGHCRLQGHAPNVLFHLNCLVLTTANSLADG